MDSLSAISEELAEIDGQVSDIFRALSNGFQKLEKIKDPNRQSRQLEELAEKMRECKRLIKEFDREVKGGESRNSPDTNRMLNEKKTVNDQGIEFLCCSEKTVWKSSLHYSSASGR